MKNRDYPPIYHVVSSGNKWRFIREGRITAIKVGDKDTIIKEAITEIVWRGGKLAVHNQDGSVDWNIKWGCE